MACDSAFPGYGYQLRGFVTSVALMESCFVRNCSFALSDSCCTGRNVVLAEILRASSKYFVVFGSVCNKLDSSILLLARLLLQPVGKSSVLTLTWLMVLFSYAYVHAFSARLASCRASFTHCWGCIFSSEFFLTLLFRSIAVRGTMTR